MTDNPDHITVAEGKYTLILEPTNMRALRYGEPWRNLVGDGFVMALGHEIQHLREQLAEAQGMAQVPLAPVEQCSCGGPCFRCQRKCKCTVCCHSENAQ